jgi:hypothetical protein
MAKNRIGRIYPKLDLPKGLCNLCGEFKELNYEHVPPQRAFNTYRFMLVTAEEYWNVIQKGGRINRRLNQGGHGIYSLCVACNSWTGGKYGRAFTDWSRIGNEYYNLTKGVGTDLYFHNIRPLRILKQISTMFIALNMSDQRFRFHKYPLIHFVRDQNSRILDPRFRFWAYYVAPGPLRMTPFCAIGNFNPGGGAFSGMEISFPPFGYMLTFDSVPEDNRLTEITGFKGYHYRDVEMLKLHLNVLPTHGPMMGDYRYFEHLPERRIDDIRYIISFALENRLNGQDGENIAS